MTSHSDNFLRAERAYERDRDSDESSEEEDMDPGDWYGYDTYEDYLK